MGRRPIDKERKPKNSKVEEWTQELLGKLNQTDLGDLTMDDLAILMNKSKSTIYEYFGTKEEIFEYITEVRVNRLKSYRNKISIEMPLKDYDYDTLAHILTDGVKDISPYFLKQLQTYFPSAWKIVEGFLQGLLNDLRELYSIGIETKMFKTVSPDMMIKIDEYFIKQLVTDYDFFETSDQTLEAVVRDYIYLKFEGLIDKTAFGI